MGNSNQIANFWQVEIRAIGVPTRAMPQEWCGQEFPVVSSTVAQKSLTPYKEHER
jgi:hypothetical protein